jgi:hypothetical protein
MVAFVDNQVPIIAREIIDDAVSDHALNHRHIQQAGGLCATATEPGSSEPGPVLSL